MEFLDSIKNFIKDIFNKKEVKELGIDLGTANTIVYLKGIGIVKNEPTYVAINKKTEEIDCFGYKAREIMGKTASHTTIIRPLKNGVISDYEITEKMLTKFLEEIKDKQVHNAKVIICVPSGVTQVERRAVVDVVKDAGAKEVYLIEEPIAAAIGVGIDMFAPIGNLIVDIGGGTTEIAFIVSGGASLSKSIKVAGDHLNDDIIEYVREKYNLLIGDITAEDLKILASSAKDDTGEYEIRGREIITGLPKSIKIKGQEVDMAMQKNIKKIVESIKNTLEQIEPEIAADIYETGIHLSGGGANIRLLKIKIEKEFNLKVTIPEDAINAVINGISTIFDNFDDYKNVIISPDIEY